MHIHTFHVYRHIFWRSIKKLVQNRALCMYDDSGNVAYESQTIFTVVPCTVQTITIVIDPEGTPEVPSKVPTPPSFSLMNILLESDSFPQPRSRAVCPPCKYIAHPLIHPHTTCASSFIPSKYTAAHHLSAAAAREPSSLLLLFKHECPLHLTI